MPSDNQRIRQIAGPAPLPPRLKAVHARYAGQLAAAAMRDPDTRRAYASRVRGYLAWLEHADTDGDPLTHPGARDGAVRDYRTWLQTTARRKPATINITLAAPPAPSMPATPPAGCAPSNAGCPRATG